MPSAIWLGVPARAVLVVERDRIAGGVGPCVATGVGEQQQREQAERLGVVGHQRREQAGQADRLVAQSRARTSSVAVGRRVALVEDQVDDVQHAREALGQLVVGRHAVGDAGGDDLALRPHEPLVHRRLGGEERPGELGDLEPAERLAA